MNDITQTTLNKIDLIITNLEISEEKQKVKENLIASIYVEMINQIGSDPQNKNLFLELSKKEPKTKEEFDKVFDYTQQKTKELGYDANLELEKACKVVLENFVQELQIDLPPEKVIALKKIISE